MDMELMEPDENGEVMQDNLVSLEKLKAIIETELSDGLGYSGSELSDDRAKALDYYYGQKKGALAAEEGRSSVVTRDVQETVEWATAQIVRMFTGDDYVMFEPQNADDVAGARQETEYVNYVIQQDNPGFRIIHDWVKDGLLSRTGIVHVQWDDTPDIKLELYEGITREQLEMLLLEGGEPVEMDTVRESIQVIDPQSGQLVQQELETYNVRIKYQRPRGRIVVQCIAPEDFVIDKAATCIEDAQFVAHKYRMTASDLRQMGVDEETIERIAGYDDDFQYDLERYARDINFDSQDYQSDGIDKESSSTTIYDCYLRFDWDGDGYDELRMVTYAGKEILANETVEEIPYATWCPVPMPHRFDGQSYADLVMDLQEIRTALMRGSLDNLYLTNLPMKEVVDGQVNMKDLLSPRVGGIIRAKAPGMIREITTSPMMAPSMQMLEFVSGERESRTGLSRYNQGMDADSLNKTMGGMQMILNQGQIRVELVARLFAENGVKRLFQIVHGFLRRHQDIPRTVKLTGGWVDVNPAEWRERTSLTVQVGLGHGTREQQIGGLQQLMQIQLQDMQMGLPIVNVEHIYNTRTKMAALLGFKDTDNYFSPPPSPEEQQQQAEMQAQQAQQQMEQQMQQQAMLIQMQEQAKAQGRMAEAQMKYQFESQKAQADHQMKLAEISAREDSEGRRLEMDRARAERDYAIRLAELQQEHDHFTKKMEMDEEFQEKKLSIEGMKYTREGDIERALMQEIRENGNDS